MSSPKQKNPKRKRSDFCITEHSSSDSETEFPPLPQRRRRDLSASNRRRRRDLSASNTDCSDSEEEARTQAERNGIQDTWPRFFLVEGKEESKPVSKISPFRIQEWSKKVSSDSKGLKSIKKLRSGALLVECRKEESEKLKKLADTNISGTPVSIKVHPSLNSSKGVIRCRELQGLSELEIKGELASEGVLDVHRVQVTKDSEKVDTNTLFLTFATPSPPKFIKIGYLRVTVTPFVPTPLRCFRCQAYGHSSKACNKPEICRNCGLAKHDGICSQPVKCVNCSGDHPANSKKCSSWIKECHIQKVKTEQKCSFSEARRLVNSNPATSVSSYAQWASASVQETSPKPQSAMSDRTKFLTTS